MNKSLSALTLALLASTSALAQTVTVSPTMSAQPIMVTPVNTPAQTPDIAPTVTLPDLPDLKKTVTVTVPIGGLSLDNALTLIARTVGMTVLTQGLPNVQLHSDLKNVTAREAIQTLINLYAPGTAATAQGKLLIVGDSGCIPSIWDNEIWTARKNGQPCRS